MDSAVTFIILLGCSSGQSVSFSMAFSSGTHLLVCDSQETAVCDEDDEPLPHHNDTKGSSVAPSVQILSSVRVTQNPESPSLLVCLLNGLNSPQQQVMWCRDGMQMMSAKGPWTKAERGYSATLVWEVSAADWRSTSSYLCGTFQEGQAYRYKLSSED